MKVFIFSLFLLADCILATAQKRPLDFEAIDSWPHIENEKISDDGRYVLYNVSSKKDGTILFVQETAGTWKIKIKNALQGTFTDDSKHVIFKTLADSLGIVELAADNVHLLEKVRSFALPSPTSGKWLVYQLQDSLKSLAFLNLVTGEKRLYPYTRDFIISNDGSHVLLHQFGFHNNEEMDSVSCIDVNSGESHSIWRGVGASNWVLNANGSQIAFVQERMTNNIKKYEIWYYANDMHMPILLVNDSTNGMQGITVSKDRIFFSGDGNNLFLYVNSLIKEHDEDSFNRRSQCIVWSYRDKVLNTSFEKHIDEMRAAVNLRSAQVKVSRIESEEGDNSYLWANSHYSNNKVILASNLIGAKWELTWRASARPDLYLVSTVDGTKTLLKKNCLFEEVNTVGFSPGGNYVFWFDIEQENWFTYNIRSDKIKNATSQIPFPICHSSRPKFNPAIGIAAWAENDASMLIYDEFDIWEVDAAGIKPPKNITLGLGRKHHEVLRLLNLNGGQYSTFGPKDSLILYMFNKVSKLNGFAKVRLDGKGNSETLSQCAKRTYGVYRYGLKADPSGFFGLEARNANAYIFKPTCDTMYPNLTFTTDFIHFHQLTDLEPQKQYNWYTDKLIHWKTADGKINEGLLFKPEDFDPNKKYPLIVFIYETFSGALNAFLTPGLCRGDMEILWYISHGYLVLLPDISYAIGHPAESAFNSVVSAVHYICKMPWVDRNRLGLQGHSFGGYETNYIVTKTNLFAAACSANGVSDLISSSAQLIGDSGKQGYYELGQGRMGATLWDYPRLYINQSPVINANKVTTPLLILHSPLDFNVAFSQGVEWFTSLRRLGKKAWMLQYPNEGHNLEKEEDQLDYSIRLNQFFDHFLKGAPAPKWMTGEY